MSYAVGDRVRVIGTPHMPGQSIGTIAIVEGTAYGIVFDGMESDGVHKWYVAEELELVPMEAAAMASDRIRLNLVSEVALSEGGAARAIHILRTGTFTGMSGTPFEFTPAHIRAIVANFQAGKRKRPPITERHDFGRAVGRMQDVWADAAYENLYSLPKWNAEGRKLLADEVYDGFSVELDPEDDSYVLVGGSLTNYPAVHGLEAVTLSAPPIETSSAVTANVTADMPQITITLPPTASGTLSVPSIFSAPPAPVSQARDDTPPLTQHTMEVLTMSDPIPVQAEMPVTIAVPPLPTVSDAGMQAQLDVYMRQMEARNEEMQRAVLAQAQAEFERKIQEMQSRSQIEAFSRKATTTSYNQPYALPVKADEFAALLAETPAGVRSKWQALISRTLSSGLLSFDEIGSSGDGTEAADLWKALVASKVAAGLSQVEAIKAAGKEQPELYAAQTRKGR